jgi:hypothetical protein
VTRDPFLRLALIALVSAYLVAVAAVDRWLGWPVALCALVGGVAGSLLLTLVLEPDAERPDLRRRHRQPTEGTKGFERIQP